MEHRRELLGVEYHRLDVKILVRRVKNRTHLECFKHTFLRRVSSYAMPILPRIIKVREPTQLKSIQHIGTKLPDASDKPVDRHTLKRFSLGHLHPSYHGLERKFINTSLEGGNDLFLAF